MPTASTWYLPSLSRRLRSLSFAVRLSFSAVGSMVKGSSEPLFRLRPVHLGTVTLRTMLFDGRLVDWIDLAIGSSGRRLTFAGVSALCGLRIFQELSGDCVWPFLCVNTYLRYPRAAIECVYGLIHIFYNSWMLHAHDSPGRDGVPRSSPLSSVSISHGGVGKKGEQEDTMQDNYRWYVSGKNDAIHVCWDWPVWVHVLVHAQICPRYLNSQNTNIHSHTNISKETTSKGWKGEDWYR